MVRIEKKKINCINEIKRELKFMVRLKKIQIDHHPKMKMIKLN